MIPYRNLFLYVATCVILGVLGYRLWATLRWRLDHPVLGVSTARTTTLRKESFVFLPDKEFKHYFGMSPGSMTLPPQDWAPENPEYSINTDGLNERFEYPLTKSDDTFRILALGDSFTFGAYVPTRKNYTEVLEDMLNNQKCMKPYAFEVINLGVPGYDIAYTVKRFVEKGIPYHPDLVLWLINGHNMYQLADVMYEREERITRSLRPDEIDHAADTESYYKVASLAQQELMDEMGVKGLLRQQLIYMNRLADAYSGTILIAQFDDVVNPDIIDTVNRFATEHPNVRVYRGLPSLGIPDTAYPDGHPNIVGHRVIADSIFTYLSQNTIYPCR